MKLIKHAGNGYSLEIEEIIEHERPPMLDVPAYRTWLEKISLKQIA
jgi:hypothetical protein